MALLHPTADNREPDVARRSDEIFFQLMTSSTEMKWYDWPAAATACQDITSFAIISILLCWACNAILNSIVRYWIFVAAFAKVDPGWSHWPITLRALKRVRYIWFRALARTLTVYDINLNSAIYELTSCALTHWGSKYKEVNGSVCKTRKKS